MGQGGRATSPGMVSLAERLEEFGKSSVHAWDDPMVVQLLNAALRSGGKAAVVGYSLGANQLGYISPLVHYRIDLGIAYDPSRFSPLVKNGVQTAPNFRKLVCYHNVGAWWFGGSRYEGPNVKTVKVNAFHLAVQFDEALHLRTIEEIKQENENV
jgi:hypothetical protein